MRHIPGLTNIDRALERLQGNHYFVKRLVVMAWIGSFLAAFLMNTLAFVLEQPDVACRQPDGSFAPALPRDACKRRDQCVFDFKFRGWTQEFDLVCDKQQEKDFGYSLMQWISSLTNLMLAGMTDFVGRKPALILWASIYIILTPLIYISDQYIVRMVLLGFVVNSAYDPIFSIIMNEYSVEGSPFGFIMMNYMFFFYSFGVIAMSVILVFVDEWRKLWLIYMGMFVVGLSGYFFSFLESPILLYKRKNSTRLINTLIAYGRINGVKTTKEEVVELIQTSESEYEEVLRELELNAALRAKLLEEPKDENKQNLVEVIEPHTAQNRETIGNRQTIGRIPENRFSRETIAKKMPHIVVTGLAMASYIFSGSLLFYGIHFSVDKIGFEDMRVNTAVLGVGSMVGYVLANKLNQYRRVRSMTATCLIALISTATSAILKHIFADNEFVNIIRALLSMVVLNVVVCFIYSLFYLYANEAVPPESKGRVIGTCVFIGRLGSSFSSYIKSYCIDNAIDLEIGFTLPCIVALFALQLLHETKL